MVKASEIVPHESNWRSHPPEQQAALRSILERIGFAGAALTRELPDGSLQAIDGHLRRDLSGEQEIPCLITDLSEEEARQILATFDPIGAMAGADREKLQELLLGVAEQDRLKLAEICQFSVPKLLIPGLTSPTAVDPDVVPEPPKTRRVHKGQIWQLGGHRLACGDCRDAVLLARLFHNDRAVLMNTDPPYGVDYGDVADSRSRGRKNGKRDTRSILNDDLDGAALQEFLEASIRAALPFLSEKPAFYLWHPMLTQGTFFAAAAAAAADIHIHRQIIWVKPSLILGRGDYHWRHELCFYGWIRDRRAPWYAGRDQDTVWQVGRESGEGHPTQKPVELFIRPLRNHTRIGEICFEPFAGSGSQLIAAEQMERRCFAVEMEPRYCDVIVERWERFTGQKAWRT